MPFHEISLWTLALAAVAYMGIGFLWYSRYLFGKKWRELIRLPKEEMGSMWLIFPINLIAAFVVAYVLALLAIQTHVETGFDGIILGFWTWLGFVATTELMNVLYQKKPLSLYFISVGYYLVAFLAMGGILGILG